VSATWKASPANKHNETNQNQPNKTKK